MEVGEREGVFVCVFGQGILSSWFWFSPYSSLVKANEKNSQEDSLIETILFCCFGVLAAMVVYLFYLIRIRECRIKEGAKNTAQWKGEEQ